LKRGVFIGLIVLLPIWAFAVSTPGTPRTPVAVLKTFLPENPQNAEVFKEFDSFLARLDKKHTRLNTTQGFLKYIFTRTHQQFLKRYAAYASLGETFTTGSYNCLTGTILFSLILDHYGIEHEVIETNYHIFILAETPTGKILIESTDPLNGFVAAADEIEKRIAHYKLNALQGDEQKPNYRFRFALYNQVSMQELRGLTYYNSAVLAFNKNQLQQAVRNFIKASELYASPRLEEFSQLLLISLQQSSLDTKTKENCMNTVLSVRKKTLPALLASAN
jgi:hypothetical protein